MHYLTLTELIRIVDSTPGNAQLADLLAQIATGSTSLRVDLEQLLRKPEQRAGSLG